MAYSPFASWLDQQLDKSGLRAKDLANKIGVSEATVSRLRSGKSKLTPHMRLLLSSGLNVTLDNIPSQQQLGEVEVLDGGRESPSVKISVVQGSIPDHATANYAVSKGIFEKHGLIAENITDKDVGLTFPDSYWEYIENYTAAAKFVLALSPESVFYTSSLKPIGSIFSHVYKGYALISRSNNSLHSVDNTRPNNRALYLKMLLEALEHKNMWEEATLFERFSWQSLMDFKFIDLLRGLSNEIIKGEKYVPIEGYADRNKIGLESLYDLGSYGSDMLVTDSGNLARAYSNPDDYSVLLSYDTIIKILKRLDASRIPAWVNNIKSIYYASNGADALERFQNYWLQEFRKLEVPVQWHLFGPEDYDENQANKILVLLEQVKQDTHKELWHPVKREETLREVAAYLQNTFGYAQPVFKYEYFKLAWEQGYSGL